MMIRTNRYDMMKYTRKFFLLLILLLSLSGEVWAALVKDNIRITPPTNGTVEFKSINDRTVTITVTPNDGYYIKRSDIMVQKLLDPEKALVGRRNVDIATFLLVSGPDVSKEEADYTFIVPDDYAGATVDATFTEMEEASVVLKPKSLTYTSMEQELITVGVATGCSFDDGTVLEPEAALKGYYTKSSETYKPCGDNDKADGTTKYYKPNITFSFTEDGEYTSTIPTGTNANADEEYYHVYYKVAPDDLHKEGTGHIDVRIEKAVITEVILKKSVVVAVGDLEIKEVKAGSMPITDTSVGYTVSIDNVNNILTVEGKTNLKGKATVSFRIKGSEIILYSDSRPTELDGNYVLAEDVTAAVFSNLSSGAFIGTLDGDFHTISDLSAPLFETISGGTVKNVNLQKVTIEQDGPVGAIAGTANGASRIYNCGILPTKNNYASGTETSYLKSNNNCCGGLVGILGGTARVINCFNYANIKGGTTIAGIVGNNANTTNMSSQTTMVMNCMFYGNISNGTTMMKPVYGGTVISNAGTSGVNNYNYYRNGKDVTFDDDYANFDAYYCTLPADEEYLTRFEYYRSILNSNRKLCVWWITGHTDSEQTAVDDKMMSKWVLDPEIAPYPILKKWGKYPSVINQDADYVWNPKTNQKVSRTIAEPYQGKKLGTISVTINAGAKYVGSASSKTKTLSSVIVMDMDTLNHDYGYAKIQLPYYNEQFGDPSADAATQWDKRYGGNYKDYVVTGWKITAVSGGTKGSFKGYKSTAPDDTKAISAGDVNPDVNSNKAWEDGFNFADRHCTNKDLYSKSGRVFAQGGYYYVPENVTAIIIEAYWGKAVYLHNKDHSVDRVNVAAVAADNKDGSGEGTGPDFGSAFTPAGTLADTFQGNTVTTNLQDAIAALTDNASYTVYDQAIVLVGNVQVKNRGGSLIKDGTRPFTIMSCDLDLDNEPDYCLQFQQRNTTNRPGIHPVRFDFLPIPELGLAIRTNTYAYAIGLMVPKGHFEITETSFMHTTQFEYDADNIGKVESPIILNGGHFEQIVVRFGNKKKISYFLLGGHFRMKRFTPGYHASQNNNNTVRHCAVNAIGGDYPEFYLSGVYQPNLAVNPDNPHCYINGGKFGTLAGAGYEQVDGDVTFKIDHAIIDNFYGGGINAVKPVTGSIDVTINNSIVNDIYCGGPEVGPMTETDDGRKTVKTTADNTIFGKFFGGGNGGTSYYREQKYDNDIAWPSNWKADAYKFPGFNPLNTEDNITKASNKDKGYHDMFEFEVFNSSNGLNANVVARTFYQWAQFGTTITGTVTNTLTNCTVEGDFFGGGNLGTVDGDVISTLTNTHVKGSAFGGGFSAEIPRVRMHNRSDASVHVPHRNKAGVIDEQGYLDFVQDNGKDRYYRWTNDNNGGKATKDAPTYWSEADEEYKCYTSVSLSGLGEIKGSTTLTINGTSQVDKHVFGGGDASKVTQNSTVNLQGDAYIKGNVFGGGNKAEVGGNTFVNIMVPDNNEP